MEQRAKIIYILEKDTKIPKMLKKWNRDVVYDPEAVCKGYGALFFFQDGSDMICTSVVEEITRDSETTLEIITDNSIYKFHKMEV